MIKILLGPGYLGLINELCRHCNYGKQICEYAFFMRSKDCYLEIKNDTLYNFLNIQNNTLDYLVLYIVNSKSSFRLS